MANKYYIAYGSNLNVGQMQRRCPGARAVGISAIEGYELLFKGSKTGSYLTIEQKEGGCVPVAVWEVTREDERALDRYEGYPSFYYKTEMTLPVKDIESGKTQSLSAFVYIMHEDFKLGLPSKSYIQTCIEGYRYFGFDNGFLKRAMHISGGILT